MEAGVWLEPDWLIIGVNALRNTSNGEGVMVIATSTLRHAELKFIQVEVANFMQILDRVHIEDQFYDLKARLDNCVIATGATYEEAIKNLFKQWKPEPSQTPALPPQKALDGPHHH